MWRLGLIALALVASGCASRTGAKAEIDAVVQSEDARQAAVNAAAADPETATPYFASATPLIVASRPVNCLVRPAMSASFFDGSGRAAAS